MSEDYISVIDVAKQIGKAKQTVLKVLKRLGIESKKMRGTGRRGPLISYITQKESEDRFLMLGLNCQDRIF
jgi:IS30 family transposase